MRSNRGTALIVTVSLLGTLAVVDVTTDRTHSKVFWTLAGLTGLSILWFIFDALAQRAWAAFRGYPLPRARIEREPRLVFILNNVGDAAIVQCELRSPAGRSYHSEISQRLGMPEARFELADFNP